MQNTDKYNFLDVVRFLFAICIVALHTEPTISALGTGIEYIYTELVNLVVPTFFIISGFFLFRKNAEYETGNLKKYIFTMTRRYLIWCIIYLPISIYEYILWDTGLIVGCVLFFKNLFLIGGHFYSRHLWYILSSVYGGILFLILRFKKASDKKLICAAIIVFLLQQLIDYIVYENINITGQMESAAEHLAQLISLTIEDGTLLAGFPYLVLSFYIVKYERKISNKTAWISLFGMLILSKITLVFGIGRFVQNTLLLLKAAFLFIGISRIHLPDSEIYSILRRTSALIFFSHRLFIFAWVYVVSNGTENFGNACFLFTLAGTMVLSCLIHFYYKRNPNNRLLKLLV